MPDRRITLATPLPPDQLLFAAMEGEGAISGCFSYELSMVGPDAEVDPSSVLGQAVTVSAGAGDAAHHVNAIVTAFGLQGLSDGLARYRATLRPALWFLSLTTDNRIFQKLSVVEIVEKVLGQHGVAFEMRLKGTYPRRDYCVQYGESDLDFVSRLLEHEGILYFFEHAEDRHVMVLIDDSPALKPVEGLGTLPWQPDERANFIDGDFVVAWSSAAAIRTRTFAHTDYDFEKPSANRIAKSEGQEGFSRDATEAYHYPGTYVDFSRGDWLAKVRMEEIQAPRLRARARATAPGLRAGATFDLDGFPRQAENRRHLILRARHRMWDGQYQSGMRQAGGAWDGGGRDDVGCEVELELQPASHPFRPERRTPRPRMMGPQTAVVVGPAGEEIFTDVGSSRVDLQACKLEYSIVSPK